MSGASESPIDERIVALVLGFRACADDAARSDFVLAHPAMLHQRVMQIATEWPPIAGSFLAAIRTAGAIVHPEGADGQMLIQTSYERFPVGRGPIEALWSQVEAKSISQAVAIEQVRTPAFGDRLTFVYVAALCAHCFKDLVEGRRELAFNRQTLVLEATECLAGRPPLTSDDDVWQMRLAAGRRWLEAAAGRLTAIADPRLLRQAEQIGERLLAEARRRAHRPAEGRLLQRLGALFLDPYTTRYSLYDRHNYEFDLRRWQDRLRDHLGREFDLLPAIDRTMPPASEALARAETYLRQCKEIPENPDREGTIPALLQALNAQELLGKTSSLEEKIALAREGLALLPAGEVDERRIRLTTWLNTWLREQAQQDGQPAAVESDDAAIKSLLETPVPELLEAYEPVRLNDAVIHAVAGCMSDDRTSVGLALIERFRTQLFDPAVADDKRRAELWRIEMILLRDLLSGQPDGDTARAERDKRIAGKLTAALQSGQNNEETKGLDALAEAVAIRPALFIKHIAALRWLRAELNLGEGRNVFNDRKLIAAARYVDAMTDFADLLMLDTVYDCLDRLKDILAWGYYPAVQALIRQLEPVARKIEAATGEPGTLRLQAIYRGASAYWQSASGETTADADTIYRTLRLAKGHWLAGALRAPGHYDWREDADALRQLAMIEAAAKELGLKHESGWGGDGPMAETLLTGQAGAHEQRPGTDAEQRYENLRLAFNDHVKRRLVEDARDPPENLNLAAFQTMIDPACVVLDCFAGEGRLFVLAITAEDAVLRSAKLPDGADPLADLVMQVRQGITAMPGFPVSRRAEPALLEGERLLLGPLAAFLAEQRDKGRDHLVVVPHGPLHFLPIHLLGAKDAPVAKDWLVTYLPVATMLRPPQADPALAGGAPEPMVAIGLDFRDGAHPGIRPVDGATDMVRALAAAHGGTALVNAEATEARVGAALASARAVHVFTHGQQCAYAAAFHALYLAPDAAASTDGILRAYEILPLRCGGLEVLTLSACESALGRFDAGDNLTGLPGSLFLAGVQRVVGTLWPVSNAVANCFFQAFYGALGEDRHYAPAFRQAQLAAREQYPQYRDWGAFYFMGPPGA